MIKINFKLSNCRIAYKEAGFTLIEVLLIMFVIVVMLISLPPLFKSVQNTIEEKNFLQQYEEDLYFAQSLAISTRRVVYYKYDGYKRTYKYTNVYGDIFIERKVPDGVTISHGHLSNFRINGLGNVSSFGNIWVQVNKKKYRIFISIGSGRFEIFEYSS